jgi:hypothetical protein
MATQARTFVYVISKAKDGAVEISTKFIRAESEPKAIEFGRKVFKPRLDDVWSDRAVEVYRA